MMNLNKDIKIIEAILFASNEPVLEEDLIEKINECIQAYRGRQTKRHSRLKSQAPIIIAAT